MMLELSPSLCPSSVDLMLVLELLNLALMLSRDTKCVGPNLCLLSKSRHATPLTRLCHSYTQSLLAHLNFMK